SIKNCLRAAAIFARYPAFRKLSPGRLNGLLNYSLSIYIAEYLKRMKCLNVDEKFQEFRMNILSLIICIEVGLNQPCSLGQKTKDEVVNVAAQGFRYYAQLMDESKSISWNVDDLPFWYDWFEWTLNRWLEIDEDPMLVFKQLQSMLLVLLKSNADPNFLRKDANFSKYLAEKIKPLFIEHFRADGLQFITSSDSIILKRLVVDCLEASESPLFTNEELNKILDILNNQEAYDL
uniref:Uncharacterized protein n=1 Tax=Romanomermis culicivorax TaxID=13658 RepID=A0A915KBW9_ROMCU